MTDKRKILICGDVKGRYDILVNRVNIVNSKSGPFDVVFCVGDFFGSSENEWVSFKEARKEISVPIYILGPNKSSHIPYYPNGAAELAPNITYLGKRGLYSTITGIKVAYLSGIEDNAEDERCQITDDDVDRIYKACIKVKNTYQGIDILLTSCWPAGITKHDTNQNLETLHLSKSSILVSKLAALIKPRYHFCALESKFYERAPYRNLDTGDNVRHITRMIALADFGNTKKEKCMYALNIQPIHCMKTSELIQMTTDTTKCPYKAEPIKTESPKQYFYDLNAAPGHQKGTNYFKRKSENQSRDVYKYQKFEHNVKITQDDCWFCISSKKFEEHLVVRIGSTTYMTLAKGPLVKEHSIIAPISHYHSYLEMPLTTREELNELKTMLKNMYVKESKTVVFFERNYKAPHLQLHAIPIPRSKAEIAKKLFLNIAEERRCPLVTLPSNMKLLDIIKPNSQYFYVEIEDYRLLHIIKAVHFPLQFGREVLAHKDLLNVLDKVDWKKCEISKDIERDYVRDIRVKLFNNKR